MATNAKPVYKRILLKLSGEALQGTEGFGIDASILDRMAQEIKELVELGIQVGVVIGGGNLFRGAGLAKAGMNRVVGDHMGMLATVMNGLAMRDALHRAYVNARRMFCAPTVCCVQPSAYRKVVVRSGALVEASTSHTFRKSAFGVPQMFSTTSGV